MSLLVVLIKSYGCRVEQLGKTTTIQVQKEVRVSFKSHSSFVCQTLSSKLLRFQDLPKKES